MKHLSLRYRKEGHITDRISKAVEQLGATRVVERSGGDAEVDGAAQAFKETVPNIEVLSCAILSLARIAQDSTRFDHGRDHVRIMETLWPICGRMARGPIRVGRGIASGMHHPAWTFRWLST